MKCEPAGQVERSGITRHEVTDPVCRFRSPPFPIPRAQTGARGLFCSWRGVKGWGLARTRGVSIPGVVSSLLPYPGAAVREEAGGRRGARTRPVPVIRHAGVHQSGLRDQRGARHVHLDELYRLLSGSGQASADFSAIQEPGSVLAGKAARLNPSVGEAVKPVLAEKKISAHGPHVTALVFRRDPEGTEGGGPELTHGRKQLGSSSEVERFRVIIRALPEWRANSQEPGADGSERVDGTDRVFNRLHQLQPERQPERAETAANPGNQDSRISPVRTRRAADYRRLVGCLLSFYRFFARVSCYAQRRREVKQWPN